MKNKNWVWFILAFSALAFAAEWLNGIFKLLDFEVYYRTATRILNGEELYRIYADDYYIFKYAPSSGIYFIPFAFFSLATAKIVYWIFLTIALLTGFHFLQQLHAHHQFSKSKLIILSFLPVLMHTHLEFRLGQVNMLLMFLYILFYYFLKKEKNLASGSLLAMSIFIKPFGLIFLPYLVLKKEYKTIGFFVLTFFVIALLPFIFYPEVSQFSKLHASYFNELKIELGNKQDLLAGANHTIFSVLARLTPLQFILQSTIAKSIYQLFVLASLGFGFLFLMFHPKSKSDSLLHISLLISLIPLLAFTSDNAFIFQLPLIMWLMNQFSLFSKFQKILFVLACVFIGGNIYDLVTPKVHHFLADISIYSIGAMLLIYLAFSFKWTGKAINSSSL